MPALRDLTGQHFGSWTVLERSPRAHSKETLWLCRCVCGTERTLQRRHLVGGNTRSCRCQPQYNFEDLTNKTFGRWTVMERAPNGPRHMTYWWCKCACGTQ